MLGGVSALRASAEECYNCIERTQDAPAGRHECRDHAWLSRKSAGRRLTVALRDAVRVPRWLRARLATQAAASVWRWSLRRLWVAVIRRHSVRTAPRPRRLKRSRRRLNFTWAKTGSIIGWRLR